MIDVTLEVNNVSHTLKVESNMRLIDLLREVLLLSSVKEGCGSGECGSCTVFLNGRAVNSCLVLVAQLDGAEIMTLEYLSTISEVEGLQEYFLKYGAVQCGFCTPGMIISALDLLNRNPEPSKEEVKKALSGNLCRCTGYSSIVEAVKKYSESNKT